MTCGICGEFKPLERNGNCASCNAAVRKGARVKESDNGKAINRLSEKGKNIEKRYLSQLRRWKKGKKCSATFPHDCSDKITCHHMAGRGMGYYDEHAAEKDIPLTLDERFWKPVCLNAHQYLTEHSKFAWENGYSFKRITDPIFIKQN
jgi:hypothetical protein